MYNRKKSLRMFHVRYDCRGSAGTALLILMLLVMVAAIAGGIFFFRKEEARVDSLSAKVQSIEKDIESLVQKTKDKKRTVNLTVPSIQKIDDVFMASKLSAEQYSGGLKVKGLIINSTALGHEDVKFRIAISDQAKEFTISVIPPGSSRKFEVYVPDVTMDKATSAQIQCLESSISYYKD